jgi:hypothetical protein
MVSDGVDCCLPAGLLACHAAQSNKNPKAASGRPTAAKKATQQAVSQRAAAPGAKKPTKASAPTTGKLAKAKGSKGPGKAHTQATNKPARGAAKPAAQVKDVGKSKAATPKAVPRAAPAAAIRKASKQQPVAAVQEAAHKGSVYRLFSTPLSFYEASIVCTDMGGRLATAHTPEVNQLLVDLCHDQQSTSGRTEDCWIGLRSKLLSNSCLVDGDEDTCPRLFLWSDNKEATFTAWLPDEPASGTQDPVQCVAVDPVAGAADHTSSWHTSSCTTPLAFICQVPDHQKGRSGGGAAHVAASKRRLSQLTSSSGGGDGGAATTGQGPKPVVKVVGNTAYLLFLTPALQPDAVASCTFIPGHLASVGSAAENEVVRQLCGTQGTSINAKPCWLGLVSTPSGTPGSYGGTLGWADGSAINYTAWYSDEATPASPCTALEPNAPEPSMSWTPMACTTPLPYVCKANVEDVPAGYLPTGNISPSPKPGTGTPTPASARNTTSFNGYSWSVMSGAGSFAGARAACQAAGGDLASVSDPKELKLLGELCLQQEPPSSGELQDCWLNMRRSSATGNWSWQDLSPWKVDAWVDGMPDGAAPEAECGVLNIQASSSSTSNGKVWSAAECEGELPFLCKKALPSPPPSDNPPESPLPLSPSPVPSPPEPPVPASATLQLRQSLYLLFKVRGSWLDGCCLAVHRHVVCAGLT